MTTTFLEISREDTGTPSNHASSLLYPVTACGWMADWMPRRQTACVLNIHPWAHTAVNISMLGALSSPVQPQKLSDWQRVCLEQYMFWILSHCFTDLAAVTSSLTVCSVPLLRTKTEDPLFICEPGKEMGEEVMCDISISMQCSPSSSHKERFYQ